MMDYVANILNENKGIVLAGLTGIASAGLMWMSQGYETLEYPVSTENQTVEIEPGVRVCASCKDGKLIWFTYDDAKTIYEAFKRGVRVSNNGPYLGARTGPNLEYEWISYQEAYDRAQQIGSGLLSLGMKPGDESFVGIFSPNKPEWVITKEACCMFSLVYIPLYDTLGPDACTYIINQTSMKIVVCDNMKRAMGLLKNADRTSELSYIILIDGDYEGADLSLAVKNNIKIMSFEELMFIGKKSLKEPIPPKPDSVATLCYTSGTTGNPKGVILTHKALISDTAGVNSLLPEHQQISSSDTHISYLPLAHMFEAIVQLTVTQQGARIGFFRGDVRKLTDDMQALRPTIFPTVPRLLNRVYDKVLMGIQGSRVKTFLFNLALRKKTELLKQGVFTKDSIWDKLVFRKVQTLMGNNIRLSIVGSAPLSASVLTFARCALGCLVMEGYGQTESTAAVSITLPTEAEGGHVGPPLLCNKIKLIDVPELDYYAKDGKGEVCTQGYNVMKGYYKEPEKTAEALEDGWVRTGDIGAWLPNGSLKIIDRRKHLFKLAQGEYLAPEKIEGIYVRSPLAAQVFVDGDSLQTYAVGVIVPDPDVVPRWARETFGLTGSMKELCENEVINKAILEDLTKLGKESGLKGFEQAKCIKLFPEMFTVENGFLTPTFKSKRPALRKFFANDIKEMYETTNV